MPRVRASALRCATGLALLVPLGAGCAKADAPGTPSGTTTAGSVAAVTGTSTAKANTGSINAPGTSAPGSSTTAAPVTSTSSSAPPTTALPSTTAAPTTTKAPTTSTTKAPVPGGPCVLGSNPDCIDPDGNGQGTYLTGGAQCMAAFPDSPGLCEDLDGDGRAGYPDSG